jgi:NADH:ubiquinone oxidoreductase subunit 4 (subunit M)
MGVETSKKDFIYCPVVVINTFVLAFFIVLFIRCSTTKRDKDLIEKRLKVSQIIISLCIILIIYHISVFIYEDVLSVQSFCAENKPLIQKLSVFSSLALSGIAYILICLNYLVDWLSVNSVKKMLKTPSKVLTEAANSYLQKNLNDVLKSIGKGN